MASSETTSPRLLSRSAARLEAGCPYYFFHGKDNPLSNWFARDFTVKGITFAHNEQFMMYCKAKLFGDHETAEKILATRSPYAAKMLGRAVKGFVEAVWRDKRKLYVYTGAVAKFTQHKDLAEFLLSTGTHRLVEASATDRIWGIGIGLDDPRRYDPTLWNGENLLGDVLEDTRHKVRTRHDKFHSGL
jgi:ribA/ribD-fused uncharacterized protein